MGRGNLLRRIAEEVLGPEEARRVWKRVEIIGDIAVIRRPFNYPIENLKPLAERILQEIPHVRSVWCTASEVMGEFRVRNYVHLAGEPRSETIYREHGCSFKLDITKVYVSPALNYEHMRIAKQVKPGEVVINMFAGAGLFSIIIAKHRKPRKVYSIDINPDAYRCMVENVKLNKVEGIVEPILGDAKQVVLERLVGTSDRVLMPLPGLSYEYLDAAVAALRGKGMIHVYEFTRAGPGEDPVEKVVKKFIERFESLGASAKPVEARVVRMVGPRKYQVVVDFEVTCAS